MITRTRVAGALAVAVALALGACTDPGTTGPTGETPPASSSSAVASSAAALPKVPLSKAHKYPDGLTLTVGAFERKKLTDNDGVEDPDAKPGDPYLVAALTWTNRGKTAVDLFPVVTVRHGTGAEPAARVYTGEARDGIWLKPGESTEYLVGTVGEVPSGTEVTYEVTDVEHPERGVAFVGPVD